MSMVRPARRKKKRSDTWKGRKAYIPSPVREIPSKPAHYREVAFTDKTGGCICEASDVERTLIDEPARELGSVENNRWCCGSHQNQLVSKYEKG